MRKFAIIFLCVVVSIMSGCSVPRTNVVPADGISVEILEKCSWDDLKNIQPVSKEDMYVQWLVEGLEEPMNYKNHPYISYGIGGIKVDEVDPNRLTEKFQVVCSIYSDSHELKVEVIESRILDGGYVMQIDVQSSNVEELEKMNK